MSSILSRAGLENRDWVEIQCDDTGEATAAATDTDAGPLHIKASGCLSFLRAVQDLRNHLRVRADLDTYQTQPRPVNHGDVLINEAVLRAQGKWNFPYAETELCHCRAIAAHVVDQAIIAGARTTETIAQQTSAGSACGSCRGDSESLIRYRWG